MRELQRAVGRSPGLRVYAACEAGDLVPEMVPQMYSASVRPSSTVKHWKPVSAVPPRTLLATSVMLVWLS